MCRTICLRHIFRLFSKVELEQNLLQRISGRCAVSIWFGSEEYKRFKVRAMNENDGIKIAKLLDCGLSEWKFVGRKEKSLTNQNDNGKMIK